MADWYVFQHDGEPLGPWSTATVANAILAGNLAPDVWVAAPGGPRWLRALDVPVIGQLVEGIPTLPRRDSGLRMIPGAFTENAAGMPVFGSTMMMVKDDEVDLTEASVIESSGAVAPPTTRSAPPLGPHEIETRETPMRAAQMREMADDEPSTDPVLAIAPPPSTTPSLPPGGVRVDLGELPSSDRRRTRRGA